MRLDLTEHGLPGRLIAVCGADGTGKSTAVRLLPPALIEMGIAATEIVNVMQPSSWMRTDPQYRRTICQEGDGAVADELAIGVFGVADRLNQQVQVIEPALAAGHVVIADRYAYCLLAYYLAVGEPRIAYLASICAPLFRPDLTIVLDCPPEVAVARVVERDGSRAEKYEQQIGPATDMIEAYRAVADSNRLRLLSSIEPSDVVLDNLLGTLQDHEIGAAAR